VSPATLAHPEWLGLALWITAAAALAVAAARRVAGGRSRRLLGPSAPASLGTFTRDGALLVALAAIALALLGPRVGERSVLVSASGVDVVFLVDVSRSMDATDVPPSRLVRARQTVSELLARLEPGDRAALAAFAGRGLLLTPLTPDRNALTDLLAGLESGFIQPASSNLASGIDTTLAAFEDGSERPRVLFVASDGEAPKRREDPGVTEAARRGVRIVTAALGSDAGGWVPDGGRVLRDRSGAAVTSRRDSERLARIAAATGGAAFVGDEWGRIDFSHAIAELRRDVGPGGEPVARRVAAVRVAPFAALAFLLLLLEGLPQPRRPRAAAAALAGAVGAALLLTAWPPDAARGSDPGRSALAAAEARVRQEPEDARAQIGLGLIHLEEGRSEAAARAFLAAVAHAREADVAAVAYYDLGVVALDRGELENAREAFFDALDLDPSDSAARFNLEWTLAAIRGRQAEPPVQSGEGAGQPPPAPDSRPRTREEQPKATAAVPPPTAQSGAMDAMSSMSAEERRRWLERTTDDTRRWLQTSARAAADAPSSSGDPPW
jgi:Ca-activated chloride channel family protein